MAKGPTHATPSVTKNGFTFYGAAEGMAPDVWDASPDEAGLYSLSVKLAGVVVFTVRAFQYAWPPLAFSIADDAEASRVYARVLAIGSIRQGDSVRLLSAAEVAEVTAVPSR